MIRIHFDYRIETRSLNVYAYDEIDESSRIPYTITLTKGVPDKFGEVMRPSATLPRHLQDQIVRALIDGLQEADLMPKMGATEAELKATKYHLEDFRKLVFKP